MSRPLEDYALIGDCETAALVHRHGSIDWMCVPRFDSPACFAALLGTSENGRWWLGTHEEAQSRRSYRGDTMVLETEYETATGAATVIDFMPQHEDEITDLIRIVVGKRGHVAMRTVLALRFDYGAVIPWVRGNAEGLTAVAGPLTARMHSPVPLHGEDYQTIASFAVHEGQRLPFVLTFHPSHRPPPPVIDPEAALAATELWWLKWSQRCTNAGPWRAAVMRSLLTLKALTYRLTGGIVAAPTTSLPELLGGVRNWDYRYCWIRDATFTLNVLVGAGYLDEARAFREWLLRAVAGKPSQMSLMYGLGGERRLPELELDWLPGYANSRPVRVGNDAHRQVQLDVYGELMDVLHAGRHAGLEPGENAWRIEKALLRHLETAWEKPDNGIWEVRGGPRHFTHSKVMAWVAFDRGIKAVERFLPDAPMAGAPVAAWRAARERIHAEVCDRGFDTAMNSFVQSYGSTELDASLLMIPLVGFLPASDARVKGTVDAIQRDLMMDGFVLRYDTRSGADGLPSGEAPFLLCSFWLADVLSLQGRREEATQLFLRLLSVRNDVGLLSEVYDPVARRLLGNFPQAFSHVGLINTAFHLSGSSGPADERSRS